MHFTKYHNWAIVFWLKRLDRGDKRVLGHLHHLLAVLAHFQFNIVNLNWPHITGRLIHLILYSVLQLKLRRKFHWGFLYLSVIPGRIKNIQKWMPNTRMTWKITFPITVLRRYRARSTTIVPNWMRTMTRNGPGTWSSDREDVISPPWCFCDQRKQTSRQKHVKKNQGLFILRKRNGQIWSENCIDELHA